MASGEIGRENLRRALASFAEALALDGSAYPECVRDVLDSGRIQKFEYSTEIFWKHLQSCLVAEGLDVPNSPRAAIKAGLDRGFVRDDEYQAALEMINDRNTCSHIYRQSLIAGILARLPGHCALMRAIVERVRSVSP